MKRLIIRVRPFLYGLMIGLVAIITSNSLGYVVMVNVMPNTIIMTSEAMK
jgi:hypothetical protein